MIVLSLLLVIAAAVCLFIGLFVVTESLTFIVAAIVLCVSSLLLLWLGTRAHKKRAASTATAPSAPVYGGGARPGARVAAPTAPGGGVGPPVRAPEGDTDDDTMVVRKTDARDRAAARVASVVEDDAEPAATPVVKKSVVKKSSTKKASTKKASTKKASTKKASTKKASAKKASTKKASTKKASAKKASTKKASTKKTSAKKASTKKASTKKASAKKTTGAAARTRLAEISGLGPAKQDALLKSFGSLESIKAASVDDLAQVKGLGDALAKRVKDELS